MSNTLPSTEDLIICIHCRHKRTTGNCRCWAMESARYEAAQKAMREANRWDRLNRFLDAIGPWVVLGFGLLFCLALAHGLLKGK